MKASIILAHPYPKSFNHAIFETAINAFKNNKVQTYSHDLYMENFNPLLSAAELGSKKSNDILVKKYTDEMLNSDYLVFIHPNWWGQPPAILKGYIDRIFRPPHAYDFPADSSGGGLPIEKLKEKMGIVYNTSNTDEKRENDYFHDPLDYIWGKCIFGFCGIQKYHRRMFRIIADSTETERKNWLNEIQNDISRFLK